MNRYSNMKILKPGDASHFTDTHNNLNNSIFLAGPCPRTDYTDD